MAVNVSGRQFRGTGLVESVIQILNRTNIPPELLELEITEGLLLDDYPETTQVFERLARIGVGFAVDDFGTGYSSLNYLRRFPVGCLKIDRTFISGVVRDPDQAVLVQAIINMARSLKLEVIAEGVETPEQLAFARENGCNLVQGFLISKPVPGDEFFRLAKGWNVSALDASES